MKKLVSVTLLSLLFLNLFSLKVFANLDYSNGAVKEEINESVQTELEEKNLETDTGKVKRSYLISNIDDYIKGTVITSGKVVLTPITITLDFVANPTNIMGLVFFGPGVFAGIGFCVGVIPLQMLYNLCHKKYNLYSSDDMYNSGLDTLLPLVYNFFRYQPITDYVWSNW